VCLDAIGEEAVFVYVTCTRCEALRRHLGTRRWIVPNVYLIDHGGRVRWHGEALAQDSEVQSMIEVTKQLIAERQQE